MGSTLTRRELMQSAIAAGAIRRAAPRETTAAEPPATVGPGAAYRRFLVDTHIPDWHPDQLARFDAARFVETIARGGAQALMLYANSHVGLALWPTEVRQRASMHANLRGRD